MFHIFKLNGHRGGFDCSKKVYYPLSALSMKILESVSHPMPEECPSSLRYAYAKYDSRDLSDAYRELYDLDRAGLLFADKAVNDRPVGAFTVLRTSAAASVDKIRSAAAEGITHLRVYIKDATPCLVSTLRETFSALPALQIIVDTPLCALRDEDITELNRLECYIQAQANDGCSLAETVLSLAARGAKYIDADIPATEGAPKELQQLAKELERRGNTVEFAPFTFSLTADAEYDIDIPACRDCWAREICGGKCQRGENTAACQLERTKIECAIVLTYAED